MQSSRPGIPGQGVQWASIAVAIVPYAALASTDFAAGAINPLLTYLTPNDAAFANVSAVQAGAVAVGNVFNGWLTGVVPARFQLAISLLVCGAANALTPAVAKSQGLLLLIRALANFTDPWSQAQTLLDPDGSSPGVTGQAVAAVLAGRVIGSLLGGYIVAAAGEVGTCVAIGACIGAVGAFTLLVVPTPTAVAQQAIAQAGTLTEWLALAAAACGCGKAVAPPAHASGARGGREVSVNGGSAAGSDRRESDGIAATQARPGSPDRNGHSSLLSTPLLADSASERTARPPQPDSLAGSHDAAALAAGGNRALEGGLDERAGRRSNDPLAAVAGGAKAHSGRADSVVDVPRLHPGKGGSSADAEGMAQPWEWAQRAFGPYGFFLSVGWWMHCIVLAGNGLVCGAFNTSVLYVLKSSYRQPLSTSSAILGADTAVRAIGAGSALPVVALFLKEPNLSSAAAAMLAASLVGVAFLRPPQPRSLPHQDGSMGLFDEGATEPSPSVGGTPMVLYVLVTGLAYTLQSVHHSSALACANAYVHSVDPKVRGLVKGSAFFAMMAGIVAMSYSALRVLKVGQGSEHGSDDEGEHSQGHRAADGRMHLFLGLAAAMLVCAVFVRSLKPVDFDRGIQGQGERSPVQKPLY